MTVYLVDFENVRSGGLQGVENLGEDDKVVIFYSKNADAITFDVHNLLSKSDAEIETFRILRGGRNSLDFQLSTYLGYLVMENCYKKIFIVSQDKGFLCATSFWEENSELCNAEIKMCKSIATSETEDDTNIDFEDGLTGKFIEKVNVKKRNFREDKEGYKAAETKEKVGKIINKPIQHADVKTGVRVGGKQAKKVESQATGRKTTGVKKELKPNMNVQNPTSKNKIFAAEIKLNVTDDIKNLVEGKYEEDYVPFLVETLGLSTGKQHFYRMLVSRLGQDRGQEIYNLIKGQYANLKRK